MTPPPLDPRQAIAEAVLVAVLLAAGCTLFLAWTAHGL